MATEPIPSAAPDPPPPPPPTPTPAPAVPATTAPVGWVIAAMILFWPTGIPALLASHRAARAIGAGDAVTAEREAANGRRWGIISVIVGAGLILVSILASIAWAFLIAVAFHEHGDGCAGGTGRARATSCRSTARSRRACRTAPAPTARPAPPSNPTWVTFSRSSRHPCQVGDEYLDERGRAIRASARSGRGRPSLARRRGRHRRRPASRGPSRGRASSAAPSLRSHRARRLLEDRFALAQDLEPERRHLEPVAAGVGRVRLARHVAALHEDRDRLGRRLLRDGGATAQVGGAVGARR